MSCIFCSIYENSKDNILYETPLTFCILDKHPIAKGHLLVIPKKHRSFLHEYEDNEIEDTLQTIKLLCKTLGLLKYNILQNNGNYQSVFHVHFHVIPSVDDNNRLTIQWNTLDVSDVEYNGMVKVCAEKLRQ